MPFHLTPISLRWWLQISGPLSPIFPKEKFKSFYLFKSWQLCNGLFCIKIVVSRLHPSVDVPSCPLFQSIWKLLESTFFRLKPKWIFMNYDKEENFILSQRNTNHHFLSIHNLYQKQTKLLENLSCDSDRICVKFPDLSKCCPKGNNRSDIWIIAT